MTIELKAVNRYTRIGNWGRSLLCPHCKEITLFYTSKWEVMDCSRCGKTVAKYDWLVKPKPQEKPIICHCCGAKQVYQEKFYSPRNIGGGVCDLCLFKQEDWAYVEALPDDTTITLKCNYSNCRYEKVATKKDLLNSYLFDFYGHPRRHFPSLNYICPECHHRVSGDDLIRWNIKHIKAFVLSIQGETQQ